MTSAIIVAAGKGTRMGANVDKLWLEVAGRPVVAHTWQRFNDASSIAEIILVVRDGMQPHFTELAEKFRFQKAFRLVVGGAERQDSVWHGLVAVSSSSEIVTIQDAARPCTTEALIVATIQAARETGAQISPILSQGEFLKALGIDIRADSLKKHATLPQAAEIDSALHRLTDEDQMGGLFKVVEVRG